MRKPPYRNGIIFIMLIVSSLNSKSQVVDSTSILFDYDTVAKRLGYPWEISYGPDDSLWITEARGYRVLRMSPNRTQAAKNVPPQEVLQVNLGQGEINFSRSIGTWPQGGMMGLAIHPEFMTGKPWVYLAYVFKGSCPPGPSNPCYFTTKIVRCRFYFQADAANPSILNNDTLVILDTVFSDIPGSNDHNSGRLTISPQPETDGTYKLYYTVGDMGAGQFNNTSRPMYAQNRDTLEGKILRLNTEPDGETTPGSPIHDYHRWRRWIPNDNPYTHSVPPFTSLRTPVYTYGHRNAQGLVWGQSNGTWRLYSSEHGDKSDDELNIIVAGRNYGWPRVAGLCDNNYSDTDPYPNNDELANQNITNEIASFCNVTSNNTPSAFSFFNWSASNIPSSGANIFTWPTIAPSSIDFYDKGALPGWRNSILVTSLKYGLYRVKLNAAGNFIDSSVSGNTVDTFPLLHGWRVRDIAISPNGGIIWAVIDSTGSTSGPTGGFSGGSTSTRDGGKILKLTWKDIQLLPLRDGSTNPRIVRDMFRIYPNPAKDYVHVAAKKNLRKPLKVQLFDINGRKVMEEMTFKNDFDIILTGYKPGVYMLKISNAYDIEVQVEKIIKK